MRKNTELVQPLLKKYEVEIKVELPPYKFKNKTSSSIRFFKVKENPSFQIKRELRNQKNRLHKAKRILRFAMIKRVLIRQSDVLIFLVLITTQIIHFIRTVLLNTTHVNAVKYSANMDLVLETNHVIRGNCWDYLNWKYNRNVFSLGSNCANHADTYFWNLDAGFCKTPPPNYAIYCHSVVACAPYLNDACDLWTNDVYAGTMIGGMTLLTGLIVLSLIFKFSCNRFQVSHALDDRLGKLQLTFLKNVAEENSISIENYYSLNDTLVLAKTAVIALNETMELYQERQFIRETAIKSILLSRNITSFAEIKSKPMHYFLQEIFEFAEMEDSLPAKRALLDVGVERQFHCLTYSFFNKLPESNFDKDDKKLFAKNRREIFDDICAYAGLAKKVK